MKRRFHILISEKHKSRFNDLPALNFGLQSFLSGKGQHYRLNKRKQEKLKSNLAHRIREK